MNKPLSPRAQRLILVLAQDEGYKCGSEELQIDHVILAMLKSADGLGYLAVRAMDINIINLEMIIEKSIPKSGKSIILRDLYPSRELQNLLSVAGEEAGLTGKDYVGTEHILLAAAKTSGTTLNSYFDKNGLSYLQLKSIVLEIERKVPSSAVIANNKNSIHDGFQKESLAADMNGASATRNKKDQNANSILAQFCKDMTQESRDGNIDPVVGRDTEVIRLIQILSRRTKNNPILVGEPGVGKTAIVEGFAQRIIKGEVPKDLAKKKVYTLDLAAMVAGTKYRGEFEDRMKRMMKEVKENRDIILFIDEMHTVIGAGGPEGSMDASNILKPALSRGELQIIGATTIKEYRKHIEKDSALARRFQMIKVEEPDENDTKCILEGLKSKYESFHHVVYENGVIDDIVKYAKRYIPERFMPDKAIDILDEAGAAKKIQCTKKPQELEDLENTIDALNAEKKQLVASQDYEKAAQVRDKVTELRSQVEEFTKKWQNAEGNEIKTVTRKDISVIISSMTGVPLEHLDDGESKRLLDMEKHIHKEVIGQDEAVRLISSAVRRSRSGVSSIKRPMGSFIFLGPTGVGKTQLAKSLAKFLFGSEDSLVRVDMSDYMEKQNASRLVGAPPGYVGFEEGGVLTEAVRQHPYSVVLLDEIEKAHPDIFNLLLQLLEEGELSDNLGHTVSFRNTVIIMTSNAGARKITTGNKMGFSSEMEGIMPYEDIKSNAIEELKKLMSPELLNRIDDVIVFDTLNRDQVGAILDIQMGELESRLAEQGITVQLKKEARDYMIEHGYDPAMGARPMRRLIQREIEDNIAMLLLSGKKSSGNKIMIELVDDKISVKLKKSRAQIESPREEVLLSAK